MLPSAENVLLLRQRCILLPQLALHQLQLALPPLQPYRGRPRSWRGEPVGGAALVDERLAGGSRRLSRRAVHAAGNAPHAPLFAGGGRQHSKTMVIDGYTDNPTVLTGSFNWSASATVANDETLSAAHISFR